MTVGCALALSAGCASPSYSVFGPGNLNPAELSAKERSVKVYHQGQQPDCAYEELGLVEATSGTAIEMGSFESSLAKLQRSAHARGATAVMVLDHSKNGMADHASGMAIRCK